MNLQVFLKTAILIFITSVWVITSPRQVLAGPIYGYIVDETDKEYTDGLVGDENGNFDFGECKVYAGASEREEFDKVKSQYKYLGDQPDVLSCLSGINTLRSTQNSLLLPLLSGIILLFGIVFLIVFNRKRSA